MAAGDVAAEADCVRREGAADALAGLAGERQDGVAAALGAYAGAPFTVVDRVGLEGEDQRVGEAEPDAQYAEGDDADPRLGPGGRRQGGTPDDGGRAAEQVGTLLAELAH